MRTLIIQLPTGLPSPALAYAHTQVTQAQAESGKPPLSLKWAVPSLLPSAQRHTETVALVPASALSWHRVDLPAGLHKQATRLHAALHGLLEDRLLDDTAQLHMALQADWQNMPRPWVAVCDLVWLSAHLQTLEQAGLTVHRIVPELSPGKASNPPSMTALGDAESGSMWFCHPELGVWSLPLSALGADTRHAPEAGHAHSRASTGLTETALDQAVLQAEPGAVALASQILGRSVQLMPPAQHWLSAAAADWDLAQWGLRANARTRHLKNWQRGASHFWHSPTWRAARWGLWLLLAGQLVGLNAWAWKTRADWQIQQDSWALLLRDTFAQTTLVIDAPLQMAQQVERLRQSSGQLRADDLESMLSALGQALPPTLAAPQEWSFQPGQLRLPAWPAAAAQAQALQQSLRPLGYDWRAQGDGWLMTVNAQTPANAGTPAVPNPNASAASADAATAAVKARP